MRRLAAFLVSLVALAVAQPGAAGTRRVLLSIDGLNLPKGQWIGAIHIDTWGVAFLATCRMPTDWMQKSEKYEDSAGLLSGQADRHAEQLTSLKQMYLLDVYDYQPLPQAGVPASFAGWIKIGSQQAFSDFRGRQLTLKSTNFHLTDAQRCPDAPPAQP